MSLGTGPSIINFIPSDNTAILDVSVSKLGNDGSKYIVYVHEPSQEYIVKNADGTPSNITFPISTNSLHYIYLVKYNSLNNPVWAAKIDVKDITIKAPNLSIDNQGNVFLIIETSTSTSLPDIYNADGTFSNLQLETYIHATPGATFIIKYSSVGTSLMVLELQGCFNTIGVSFDKNSNICVTTTMYNSEIYLTSTDIDTITALPQNGSVLVAKFTANGTYIWSRTIESVVIHSTDLCMDYDTGDIYIPIKYQGIAKLYESSQVFTFLPSLEYLAGVLLKLDLNGSLKWSILIKGLDVSSDSISAVIDKYHNIYIVFSYNYIEINNEPCVIDAVGRQHIIHTEGIDQTRSCALVRLSIDGVFLWKVSMININNVKTNLVFDYMSNIIMSFRYTGATTTIKTTQSNILLPLSNFKTVIVTSFNPDGVMIWKKIPIIGQDIDSTGHLSCSPDSFKVGFYLYFDQDISTISFADGEELTPLFNTFGGLVCLSYTMIYPAIQGGITMEESMQVFPNAASNDMTLYCTRSLQKIHMGHSLNSSVSMLEIDRYRVMIDSLEVSKNAICHKDFNILGDIYQKGNPLSLGYLSIDTPNTSNIDPMKQWSILSDTEYVLTSSLTAKQNGLVKIITNSNNTAIVNVNIMDSNGSNTLNIVTLAPQTSRMLAWNNYTWYNLGSFGS